MWREERKNVSRDAGGRVEQSVKKISLLNIYFFSPLSLSETFFRFFAPPPAFLPPRGHMTVESGRPDARR